MAITHRCSRIRAHTCLTLLIILQHSIARPDQSERRQGSAVPTLIEHADTNQDGDLGRDEIQKIISSQIGGRDFDSADEISHAANSMFERLDTDQDGIIEQQELTALSSAPNWLRSVDQTASWLLHSMQQPQYETKFRRNSITGLDFPQLIQENGKLLREDVGVTSKLHHRQLLRGMRMVFFGVASLPPQVNDMRVDVQRNDGFCNIEIEWEAPDEPPHVAPVHKYEMYCRTRPTGGWHVCYDGSAKFSSQEQVKHGTLWEYKVRGWNLVGPSVFTIQHAASCPASSVNSLLQQWLVTACSTLIVAFVVRFVLKLSCSVKASASASPTGSPRSRPRKVNIPTRRETKGGASSDELTPMTPLCDPWASDNCGAFDDHDDPLSSSVRPMTELMEKEPGVWALRPQPDQASPPDEAPDEVATMSQRDWSSDEEDTPPGSVPTTPVSAKPGECTCGKKLGKSNHICRMCCNTKCKECTNVGCRFSLVCGDLCICFDCEARNKRRRQEAESARERSSGL